MKAVKMIFKGIFWVLIIALLLSPLVLIYELSNREMEQYQMPDPPQFADFSQEAAEMEAYKDRDDDSAVRISGGGTVIKYSEWE